MHRYGYTEECYFDYTLSPIVAADGSIGGVFNAVIETTYRFINARRNLTLQALLQRLNFPQTVKEGLRVVTEILEAAELDIPFFLIYSGAKQSDENPQLTAFSESGRKLAGVLWPKTDDVLKGESVVLQLADHPSIPLIESNYWSEALAEVCLVPLIRDDSLIIGYAVLGVSPRKRLDEDYLNFLDTVGLHTGTIVNNAYAKERSQEYEEELGATNEELTAINEELYVTQEQLRGSLERIEESEASLRFMLDAIPQHVWTATPDGVFDYVNLVMARDFGEMGKTVAEYGLRKFIHPDDIDESQQRWQNSLDAGIEYTMEHRLRMHDGVYQWHLTRALPFIEDGEIKSWIGTNTNIEQQKANEQRKDEFLSIASHELKTPLTSIKAFNQLMQRENDGEKLRNFIVKSADHVRRLEKLISDLLDVTKINAGKMTYNMEPFRFDEMLLDTVQAAQLAATGYDLEIKVNTEVMLTGDHLRLEQVINNFLTNAIKYSPDSKKIIIKSEIEEGEVVFSVKDFGIGIAKAHLDRLFERYYRVDNTAMRFEGLGLGLFISSEILRRHHGSFWIDSEEGKGSTFYFRLPLKQEVAHGELVLKSVHRYESKHLSIFYNAHQQWLEADWKGFQNFETVKEGCMAILDRIRKNNCGKLLNDNRRVLGTWSEASEWVGMEWFPLAEEAGLKYVAWIVSPSAFSQLSAQKSVDVKQGNIIAQFFTDSKEAEAWLSGVV
nr:PAS domain-containing sensor histidine kinase [Mucilaginibacter straminoryzae]